MLVHPGGRQDLAPWRIALETLLYHFKKRAVRRALAGASTGTALSEASADWNAFTASAWIWLAAWSNHAATGADCLSYA